MEHVQLPLSALPAEKTSITYPDSFTAMGFGAVVGRAQESRPYHGQVFLVRELPRQESRPYHGQVFLVRELPRLVERYGVPSPSWTREHEAWTSWPDETYIEVQLWSDDPVHTFLEVVAK